MQADVMQATYVQPHSYASDTSTVPTSSVGSETAKLYTASHGSVPQTSDASRCTLSSLAASTASSMMSMSAHFAFSWAAPDMPRYFFSCLFRRVQNNLCPASCLHFLRSASGASLHSAAVLRPNVALIKTASFASSMLGAFTSVDFAAGAGWLAEVNGHHFLAPCLLIAPTSAVPRLRSSPATLPHRQEQSTNRVEKRNIWSDG